MFTLGMYAGIYFAQNYDMPIIEKPQDILERAKRLLRKAMRTIIKACGSNIGGRNGNGGVREKRQLSGDVFYDDEDDSDDNDDYDDNLREGDQQRETSLLEGVENIMSV